MEKRLSSNELKVFRDKDFKFKHELVELMKKHDVIYLGNGIGMDPNSPWSMDNLHPSGLFKLNKDNPAFIKINEAGFSDGDLWIDFKREETQTELDFLLDQIKKLPPQEFERFVNRITENAILGLSQEKL